MQNQAHLDMLLADGTTVIELVANKVPCTVDVFTQMLDKSIIIDEKESGLVSTFTQFGEHFHSVQVGPILCPTKLLVSVLVREIWWWFLGAI